MFLPQATEIHENSRWPKNKAFIFKSFWKPEKMLLRPSLENITNKCKHE